MRKLSAAIASLFLSPLAAFGYTGMKVTVPSYQGGLTFGVQALYLRPTTLELDYAEIFPTNDQGFSTIPSILGTPLETRSRFLNIGPKNHFGYELDFGYIFPNTGNSIDFSYMEADLTDLTHFPHPELNGVLKTLGNISTNFTRRVRFDVFPDIPGAFFTQTVLVNYLDDIEASTRFNYSVFDLSAGQDFLIGNRLNVKFHVGLRYADLDSRFNNKFYANVTDPILVNNPNIIPAPTVFITKLFGQDTIKEKSLFRGVGPRIGFTGTYNLVGNFGIVGGGYTSLLIGRSNSSYSERLYEQITTFASNIIGVGTDIFIVNEFNYDLPKTNRIVPNLDAKLGVSYTYTPPNCARASVIIEAGYKVSQYFNNVERLTNATETLAIRGNHTIDQGLDGPYLSLHVAL